MDRGLASLSRPLTCGHCPGFRVRDAFSLCHYSGIWPLLAALGLPSMQVTTESMSPVLTSLPTSCLNLPEVLIEHFLGGCFTLSNLSFSYPDPLRPHFVGRTTHMAETRHSFGFPSSTSNSVTWVIHAFWNGDGQTTVKMGKMSADYLLHHRHSINNTTLPILELFLEFLECF